MPLLSLERSPPPTVLIVISLAPNEPWTTGILRIVSRPKVFMPYLLDLTAAPSHGRRPGGRLFTGSLKYLDTLIVDLSGCYFVIFQKKKTRTLRNSLKRITFRLIGAEPVRTIDSSCLVYGPKL